MRHLPALIVAALSGVVASMILGFFVASWTMSGMGPAVPPRIAIDTPAPTAASAADDDWREAGYEKIGLWEHAKAPD